MKTVIIAYIFVILGIAANEDLSEKNKKKLLHTKLVSDKTCI